MIKNRGASAYFIAFIFFGWLLTLPTPLAAQVVYNDTIFFGDSARVQPLDSLQQPRLGAIVPVDSAQITEEKEYLYADSVYPLDPALLARMPYRDSLPRTLRWFTDGYTGFDYLRPIDSSLRYVHHYDPTFRGPFARANIGVEFGPTHPDEFSEREHLHSRLPFFTHAIKELLPLAKGYDSYSSQGPYSEVTLGTNFSSRKSQLVGRIFYSQNVMPAWNLGIELQHVDNTGEYINLSTRANAVRLFSSYAKGRIYTNAHAAFVGGSVLDNKGLQADYYLTDRNYTVEQRPLRSHTPKANFRSRAFTWVFEYDLLQRRHSLRDSTGIEYVQKAPLLALRTEHHYRRYTRSYMESHKDAVLGAMHFSNMETIDTAMQQVYEGTVGVRLRQLSHARVPLPGIRAAVGYELNRFVMPRADQYLTGRLAELKHSLFVEAGTDYRLSYLDLQAYTRVYLLGFKLGDVTLHAEASYYPIRREGGYAIQASWRGGLQKPHYFVGQFLSNRYAWDNLGSFGRTFASELKASFVAAKWGGEYGAVNSSYSNYTYFSEAVTPAQIKALNVLGVYAQQTFDRWGLALVFRGMWQKASSALIDIPGFTLYGSIGYGYEFIKEVLTVRLGAEVYYNTPFHMAGYDSDLGVYYAQREAEIGGYPLINVHLLLKWKNANVFARVLNVTDGLIPIAPFASLHRPWASRAFRFGLNWYFYR